MEPFLGQIIQVPWHWEMRGWAKCQGQLLPIQQYTSLYSLIGTNYGGDGIHNFALPDLRPRDENNQPRDWGFDEIVSCIAMQGSFPPRN